MSGWTTRERRTLLRHGRFLTVEEHDVTLPDGRRIDGWSWVVTPDYVNVFAVTREGRILCLEVEKYAAAGLSLALPGGFVEPGEAPLAAAQRELREETGHTAPEWTALGSFAVDANRGAGRAHFFMAFGAVCNAPPVADDLENPVCVLRSPAEVEAALHAEDIRILPWAALAALGLLRLRTRTGKPPQ